MSYVVTLVAANAESSPVAERHIHEAEDLLETKNIRRTCADIWLSKGKAVDIGVSEKPPRMILQQIRSALNMSMIDVFATNIERRRKKLLLADMDSTIVKGETLDDLAEFAGIKDKIAEITQRAMNGELDFHSAIRERVGLLKNLPADSLDKTLATLSLNPGAQTLVSSMKKQGAHAVLVSGGFTFFTEAVAKQVGFDNHHGNILGIEGGALTGKVKEPILDKHAKVEFLKHYIEKLKIRPEDCVTIGDGANDLPMLSKAGLGLGYKPKPAVAREVDNMIIHGDLSTALYAQGYSDQDIMSG